MRKVFAAPEVDTIESFDLDRGHGFAAGVVRQNETEEKRLAIHVWEKPDVEAEAPSSPSGDDQVNRKLPTTSVLRHDLLFPKNWEVFSKYVSHFQRL